jgi:chromosome segregation ATPase
MKLTSIYYILFALLGLLILLSIFAIFLKRKFKVKLDYLNNKIKDKESCLLELENRCIEKKKKLDRIVIDSIFCKAELLQTSNKLRKKSDELYRLQERLKNMQDKISNIEKIEEKNRQLLRELFRAKEKNREFESLTHNDMLLQEFKRLKGLIEARDREIENFRKQYKMEKNNYLKISKDQFKEIENRLREYKKKSEKLQKKTALTTSSL